MGSGFAHWTLFLALESPSGMALGYHAKSVFLKFISSFLLLFLFQLQIETLLSCCPNMNCRGGKVHDWQPTLNIFMFLTEKDF